MSLSRMAQKQQDTTLLNFSSAVFSSALNWTIFLFQASFVSDKSRMDIDLDDPDFWTKWAQKASIDVSEMQV